MSLKDIHKIKKDYLAIGTFSGCGGSSTGFKMAGFNVLLAVEFIDIARETYEINHPDTVVTGSDIRKLDPAKIMSHFGIKKYQLDTLEGSPPCFTAGHLITTSKGLNEIENVRVGDYVLTHEQRYRRVTELLPKMYKGRMYNIDCYHSQLEATAEHPVYARLNVGGKRIRELGEPSWIRADELTLDHYVGIPSRYEAAPYVWEGVEKVFYHRGSGEYVPFGKENTLDTESKDFWWLVGRWLGDGWTRFSENAEGVGEKRKQPRHNTIICCDKTDGGEELREICQRFDALGVKYGIKERRTCYRVGVASKEWAAFFQQFGSKAHNKSIPMAVLNLPRPLLAKLLEGYLSADGTLLNAEYGHYRFSSVSHKLALGISIAVSRVFGVPVTNVRKGKQHPTASVIEGRTVNCKPIYVGEFRISPQKDRVFYEVDDDGIIWVPVNKIESRKYRGPVFNFSVDEDETYVANNLIVHNCKSYSTAGAISDNWGAEVLYSEGVKQRTDDLFDEYIRLVEAFRPKTFVAENVSGLVKGDSRGVFVEIMEKFRALGYRVSAPLLNSAWLGVPQNRERIIFIGVREDLKIDPPRIFPMPEICTVSESLDHISYIKATHKGHLKYVPASVPQPTITVADAISYETARFSSGGFVETVAGERRKYSIEELKVICGFPKDYKLIGTFEQQWERLGRAVPPMMMYHVAKAVREQVLDVYYARKSAKPGSKIK